MNNVIEIAGKEFIEVQLSVLVLQQDDFFLAYCPALQMSSYGDSIADAKIAFEEVLEAYLEDCSKYGTLEKDLTSRGWDMQINAGRADAPDKVEMNLPAGI